MDRDILFPDCTVKEVTVNSDYGFCSFLSKLNLEREKLVWGTLNDGTSAITEILYPTDPNSYFEDLMKKRYWDKYKDQLKVRERIPFDLLSENRETILDR